MLSSVYIYSKPKPLPPSTKFHWSGNCHPPFPHDVAFVYNWTMGGPKL